MEWILERFAEPIFGVLIETTLKGTLTAAVLIAITSILGRRRSRLRSLLLNIGLVAFLLVPLISLGWYIPTDISPAALDYVAPQTATGTLSPISIPIEVDHRSFPLAVLAGLYGLGILVIFVRLTGSVFGLFRLKRTLVPIRNPATLDRMRRIQTDLGIRRRVSLARSKKVDSPCQMGIFRPVIVLPADREFPGQDLDTILLHELIHITRYDCLFKILGSVCIALHWFNPLVWIVVARNARIQDQVCDDWVVYLQKSPDRYIETLISVVRGFRTPGSFIYQLDMAQGSGFLERIRRIRELGGLRPSLGSSGYTLSLATACALVTFAASLRVIVAPLEAVPQLEEIAILPAAPEMDVHAVSPAPSSQEEIRITRIKLPRLVRPEVEFEVVHDAEEPDAWLSPAVLSLVAVVEPMQLVWAPPKLKVTNEDIMIYPEPGTYSEIAAANRLLAPPGATYYTSLTMGRVMGTQFQSRPFYTGLSSSDREALEERQREEAEKSGPVILNRVTSKKHTPDK